MRSTWSTAWRYQDGEDRGVPPPPPHYVLWYQVASRFSAAKKHLIAMKSPRKAVSKRGCNHVLRADSRFGNRRRHCCCSMGAASDEGMGASSDEGKLQQKPTKPKHTSTNQNPTYPPNNNNPTTKPAQHNNRNPTNTANHKQLQHQSNTTQLQQSPPPSNQQSYITIRQTKET